jgi:putative endopeptidase
MRQHRYTSAVFGALGVLVALGSAWAQEPAPVLRHGKWGFDFAAMDPAARPGDDFFKHANGAWLARTEIPPDKTRMTLRVLMTDATEARLYALLESAASHAGHEPGDLEGKIGAFYKAFMNETAIETLGAKPLAPMLAAIRAATTHEALGTMMGRATHDFGGSFFGAYIDIDAKDPGHYAVQVYQDGLGLPDLDNYLATDPNTLGVKAAYQAYVERLLSLIDWPAPAESALQIVTLETRIAEAHWTKAEAREVDDTYNPMTVAELQTFAPSFPWRSYLAQAKLGSADRVIVAEKSAFPKIAEVFAGTPVEILQAWLAFNAVDQAAPYLSKPFVEANFEMHEKTILGRKEQ